MFDETLEVNLSSEDTDTTWRCKHLDTNKLLLIHSEGRRIVELLSELITSAEVLQRHQERLASHVDCHIFELDRKDKIDIAADLKAYLAEAHSLKNV